MHINKQIKWKTQLVAQCGRGRRRGKERLSLFALKSRYNFCFYIERQGLDMTFKN